MADLDITPGTDHEDLAGYILGALDPEERERFAAHLASCTECQQAADELGPAARALESAGFPSGLLTDAQPPGDLEQRSLDRVKQAAGKKPQATPRRRLTRRQWLVSAAAAVVVVAGAGTAVALLQRAPAASFTIPMRGQDGSTASGQAVAHHTASGWSIRLTVHGLQQLPRGHFYECWYASPDSRFDSPDLITAGTFTVGSGGTAAMQMWSAADPRDFPTMQITEEKAGDARQHGTVILSGTAQA